MKNEINDPNVKVKGDTPDSRRKEIAAARRDSYSGLQNEDEAGGDDISNQDNPPVRDANLATQGLDSEKPKSRAKLWFAVGLLSFVLIVVAGFLVVSILRNNRREAIDVGAADKKDSREQQYKQADETLKTAFANTNSTNAAGQPTPPPALGNANQNSSTAANPKPYPLGDWDKVPNPNPAPTGKVGDSLTPGNANTAATSPPIKNSIGGGGGGEKGNAGTVTPRQNPVPVGNPQILEVGNNDGRTRNYSSGSRNQQSSIYYYARNTEGEPTLNKLTAAPKYILAQKPRFNDVFPVRLLGAVHSLGSGGLARMILTRPVEGNGYFLPKGTFFIGRVSGGEGNRLFIALVGYIDPQTQGLVALGGDVNGVDGGLGLKGERKRLDNRFKKYFNEAWKTSRELGIAYLLGRKGGGGNWNGGLDSRVQSLSNSDENQTKEFILVQSGQEGYIVVNDLPPATEKPNSLPLSVKPEIPNDIKVPVDASSISENDLNALSGIGEAQIKELLALSPEERERRIQTFSPQLQAILREILK